MKNSKSQTLDFIRVTAMLGILADHYIQRFADPFHATGLWLGGVNIAVFFALSAFLFGEKWRNHDNKKFKTIPFLRKRIQRIYIPLWISLVGIIIIEHLVLHHWDALTILLNIIGGGWARPFGVGGHLWYITMTMILYCTFIIFSCFRLDKKPMGVWGAFLMLIIAAYALLPEVFSTFSKAGPPVILCYTGLLFYKGDKVQKWATEHKLISVLTTAFLIIVSWSLFVIVPDFHSHFKTWETLMTSLTGFAVFLTMQSVLRVKENAFMKAIAGISYELYLVHLPLLPLVGMFIDSEWFFLPIWMITATACAYCTNYISSRIIKEINGRASY